MVGGLRVISIMIDIEDNKNAIPPYLHSEYLEQWWRLSFRKCCCQELPRLALNEVFD